MKAIRTIAGLQRLHDARNRRAAKFYRRPYVLEPALARYLEHFERLNSISDESARYEAFCHAPSLEYELETFDASISPQQRISLAQQDRARKLRSRVTEDGTHLEQLIATVLEMDTSEKKAKQYWLPFTNYLRAIDLAPVLKYSPQARSGEQLEYGLGGRRLLISLRQFENIVSRVRRKRRSATRI
jgi:hypothetical protein